jgi:ankyrin repeat protein
VFVSQDGGTALHLAAQGGHLPLVELLFDHAPQLIEARTNVSAAWCVFDLLSLTVLVSQQGATALHSAAYKGHLPLIEFLFERAPQLIEMRDEVSAAWWNVIRCSLTVFLSQDGRTALHKAAFGGCLPVVEFLFEHASQLIEMRTNVSAARCVSGYSL